MFPMQKRQLSLSTLFKKPVHNDVRHFSCYVLIYSGIEEYKRKKKKEDL